MAKQKTLKQRLKNYGQIVELCLILFGVACLSMFTVVACIIYAVPIINEMGVIVGISTVLVGCIVGMVGFVMSAFDLVRFIISETNKENKEGKED